MYTVAHLSEQWKFKIYKFIAEFPLHFHQRKNSIKQKTAIQSSSIYSCTPITIFKFICIRGGRNRILYETGI